MKISNKSGNHVFEKTHLFVLNFGPFKQGAAMTIPGVGIFVGPSNIRNTDVLRHEFGHILQHRLWGSWTYWFKIVPASLKSAIKANRNHSFNHMNTWTECSSNQLSYIYFNKPADWNMSEYPIDN